MGTSTPSPTPLSLPNGTLASCARYVWEQMPGIAQSTSSAAHLQHNVMFFRVWLVRQCQAISVVITTSKGLTHSTLAVSHKKCTLSTSPPKNLATQERPHQNRTTVTTLSLPLSEGGREGRKTERRKPTGERRRKIKGEKMWETTNRVLAKKGPERSPWWQTSSCIQNTSPYSPAILQTPPWSHYYDLYEKEEYSPSNTSVITLQNTSLYLLSSNPSNASVITLQWYYALHWTIQIVVIHSPASIWLVKSPQLQIQTLH